LERKIISLSANTKVISLPLEWCRKNSLKKGDILKIEPHENKIIVKTQSFSDNIINIDFQKHYSNILLRKLKYILFTQNYDVINFSNINKKNVFDIERIVYSMNNNYEVDEILEKSNGFFTLKIKRIKQNISEKNVDSYINKVFFNFNEINESFNMLFNSNFDEQEMSNLINRINIMNSYVFGALSFINNSDCDKNEYFIISNLFSNFKKLSNHISSIISFNDLIINENKYIYDSFKKILNAIPKIQKYYQTKDFVSYISNLEYFEKLMDFKYEEKNQDNFHLLFLHKQTLLILRDLNDYLFSLTILR
jgi:hypothetical protein